MKNPQAMPWKQMMSFGFGKLGLSAAQFWSMTPRELAAAMRWHSESHGAVEPMNRSDLDDLTARFPDQQEP